MWVVRLLSVFGVFFAMWFAVGFFLRRGFPGFYARGGRRAMRVGAAVLGLSAAMWFGGRAVDLELLQLVGMVGTSLVLVTVTLLFVSSIVWGPLSLWLAKRLAQPPTPAPPVSSPSRRAFLSKAVGTLPASAAALGPVGAGATLLTPVVRQVSFDVPGLDPRLDGLSILQLTDVHLGTFIGLDHVRAALDKAQGFAPELVVFTGDIADDFDKLGPALDMAATLQPPLGVYASIGNHEIYRGRAEAEAIYNRSPATYLCETGEVIERNGARLYLCGADDPARLGGDHSAFLEQSVARALDGCPDDIDCKIVLSHRPEGFKTAAQKGATLTLAGHTHGGQVALLGRSVFELFAPDAFLLGRYKKQDRSFLYTSAGLGHWFPFRLNCPCEVALIRLHSVG